MNTVTWKQPTLQAVDHIHQLLYEQQDTALGHTGCPVNVAQVCELIAFHKGMRNTSIFGTHCAHTVEFPFSA